MERLVVPDEECTHYSLHTPAPSEYTVWREWADEKSKTHIQLRCPGTCGLWNVWIPRDALCVSCGPIAMCKLWSDTWRDSTVAQMPGISAFTVVRID